MKKPHLFCLGSVWFAEYLNARCTIETIQKDVAGVRLTKHGKSKIANICKSLGAICDDKL